jgi:hypothetical protein
MTFMNSADQRLIAGEKMPRKRRKRFGSSSCDGVRNAGRLEKEEMMSDERPMRESGTESDSVG